VNTYITDFGGLVLKLDANEVWLDAGSGVGRLSLVIAPKVKKLVCIDHSMVSLNVLKENAEASHLANIQIIKLMHKIGPRNLLEVARSAGIPATSARTASSSWSDWCWTGMVFRRRTKYSMAVSRTVRR
jgi:hypothetical protein